MSANILIVEDESLVAMEVSSALKKEGYTIVGTVGSAEEVFKSFGSNIPDLILMDINIDGTMNGIELSRRIKKTYNIPIIFLTAYNDKETIDRAIQTSPAGYLIKPFKRQELYAVVSLAMSKNIEIPPTEIKFSMGCVYYPDDSKIIKDLKTVPLTKKEKQLLDLLLRNKDKLVSFETIEYELWPDKIVSATTLRTLTHRLREKIGENHIKTAKDFGYILQT